MTKAQLNKLAKRFARDVGSKVPAKEAVRRLELAISREKTAAKTRD